MDARKSVIFAFQFVKSILQTIANLIQYMVLEIQFWSAKCMTVTVRFAKISSISIPCHEAMQAIAVIILAIWKQTTSKCFWKYLALPILLQICYVDRLFYAEK